MKIILLTDNFPPQAAGGAAVIAFNTALALSEKGNEVHVITTSEKREDEGTRAEKGFTVHTLHSSYRPLFRAFRSLKNRNILPALEKIIKEIQPDIVHAHNIHYYLSYHSLAIARNYAKAVFITIHDSMPFHYSKLFPESVDVDYSQSLPTVKSYKVSPLRQFRNFKWQYNPFRNAAIKKYLAIPDRIFAVSGALAKALSDNGIGNVEVLHNSIDAKAWIADDAETQDFISRHNLSEKKAVFFGGRLSRAKGGEVLLLAMAEVIKKEPNAVLLAVGEKDAYADAMLEKARILEIENNIVFTGWMNRQSIKYAYAASQLVVVPSLCFDWFPTNILEAMASTKPAIGSVFGGASEMIADGITGYVIDPRDPHLLAEKILAVLSHEAMAKEFGQRAYERVQDFFSPSVHFEILFACYDRALKKSKEHGLL